jgi:hypothetical protein
MSAGVLDGTARWSGDGAEAPMQYYDGSLLEEEAGNPKKNLRYCSSISP